MTSTDVSWDNGSIDSSGSTDGHNLVAFEAYSSPPVLADQRKNKESISFARPCLISW